MKQPHVDWTVGDVTRLPFRDAAFSAVLTRFSFHHFRDPGAVLREMIRVAEPDGKIDVIDVYTTSKAHSRLHNLVEKLRNDSHVRALSLSQLRKTALEAGLTGVVTKFYGLEIGLERQLEASFPKPGDDVKIRMLAEEDAAKGKGSLITRRKGKNIYFFYPVVIISGRKA